MKENIANNIFIKLSAIGILQQTHPPTCLQFVDKWNCWYIWTIPYLYLYLYVKPHEYFLLFESLVSVWKITLAYCDTLQKAMTMWVQNYGGFYFPFGAS